MQSISPIGIRKKVAFCSAFCLGVTISACQSRQQPVGFAIEPPVFDRSAIGSPTIRIPLRVGDHWDAPRVRVTVKDPVYFTDKSYEGVRIDVLLASIVPTRALPHDDARIVLIADDGYRSTVTIGRARTFGGVLAFRDIDAPSGLEWVPFPKDGQSRVPGPFYLVWERSSENSGKLPWPYGVIGLELWNTDPASLAKPDDQDTQATVGFSVFQSQCMSCHSINEVGGAVGPELNVPANVTEYWNPTALRQFIRSPSSIRHASRMPSPFTLTDDDLDAVLAYLSHMKKRKVRAAVPS